MNKTTALLLAVMAIAGIAVYSVSEIFHKWRNPAYVADVMAKNFAYYLSEDLVEEGLFYPSNDLNDPLLEDRVIVINHTINEHTSKDVVRKLLYLNSLDNKSPIDLYISTQGGWYDYAFAIIDTFHAIDAPVNTNCIGGCYSAGLLIVASGTGKRVGYQNAHFSAHISYGESEDTRAYAEQPDRVNAYLKRNTKLPEDWFPLEDDRSYYLTAQDAVKYDIIDFVAEGHRGDSGQTVIKDE